MPSLSPARALAAVAAYGQSLSLPAAAKAAGLRAKTVRGLLEAMAGRPMPRPRFREGQLDIGVWGYAVAKDVASARFWLLHGDWAKGEAQAPVAEVDSLAEAIEAAKAHAEATRVFDPRRAFAEAAARGLEERMKECDD